MRLLLIEDEPRMRLLLQRGLTEEGHVVDACASSAEAVESLRYSDFDVIVLDWGLPDSDGITLLRQWRNEGLITPVLMLTARGAPSDKVLGLRSGADDFLGKPFDFEELIARLEALHRRTSLMTGGAALLGDLQFQRARRQLVGAKGAVDLTSREFQLLSAFAERVGDLRTRSELLRTVWGPQYDGLANVVDVYVGYLRAKIEQSGSSRVAINTVRGSGYRLEIAPDIVRA